MIPFVPAIVLLLVGGLIGATLTIFWDEIRSFLEKSISKVKEYILPAAIKGFKVFLKTKDIKKSLMAAGLVIIQKFFSKEEDVWTETIVTKNISADEIPSDLKAKLESSKGEEIDISDRVVAELKLEG